MGEGCEDPSFWAEDEDAVGEVVASDGASHLEDAGPPEGFKGLVDPDRHELLVDHLGDVRVCEQVVEPVVHGVPGGSFHDKEGAVQSACELDRFRAEVAPGHQVPDSRPDEGSALDCGLDRCDLWQVRSRPVGKRSQHEPGGEHRRDSRERASPSPYRHLDPL